ncbi:hypothetical protein HYPSUDRAFT_1070310 [Hypholoma sublateritium FD-334 SS-4]|uniref:Uncharacterized protein n=1 Tax=Hypholoma sublateritium (strain FD-334 SS-4) TaxID=945553 RepID=A0A0D2NEF4_HYPSF|nr:hypothetical protein HYPSUDRAFT_1070310 [Hypholoma sublateritium FD-334 SS-4]
MASKTNTIQLHFRNFSNISPMGSGKGPGFSGNQLDWLKRHLPEYIAKTAYGKPTLPHQPLPNDDNDLSSWVRARRDEFEATFGPELQVEIDAGSTSAAKIRESFDVYFRNRKHSAKMKWAKSTASLITHNPHVSSLPSTTTSTPTTTIPSDVTSLWSSLLNATSLTGRQLFDQDMRSSASAAINELRKSNGIGPKMHVGMLHTRLKELWEDLDDLEKEDWQRKAKDIKESMSTDILSRNQTVFHHNVSVLLSSLIGSTNDGNHKIGNARFHLLYSFRDDKDRLKTGCIDISSEGPDESVPYEFFKKDYAQTVLRSWIDFCNHSVKHNKPLQIVDSAANRITYDARGCPMLPCIDLSTSTVEEIRKILVVYLDKQWDWSNALADKETDSHSWGSSADLIPWDFPEELMKFVNPSIAPVSNPISASPIVLFSLLDSIQSLQTVDTGAYIFHRETSTIMDSLDTIPSRDASPSPFLSSNIVQSSQAQHSLVEAPTQEAQIPAAVASSSVLSRTVSIRRDAPTEAVPTTKSSITAGSTTVSAVPISTHPVAQNHNIVTTSFSVPSRSIPLSQDAPMEAPRSTQSPVQPNSIGVTFPLSQNSISTADASSASLPGSRDPLAVIHETISEKPARGRKRKRKSNNSPASTREQPKRSRITPPEPVAGAAPPSLGPAQDLSSTNSPLKESPIRLNRNGKPLKHNKFWKYVTQ